MVFHFDYLFRIMQCYIVHSHSAIIIVPLVSPMLWIPSVVLLYSAFHIHKIR